jgi:ribosomal protein S24E
MSMIEVTRDVKNPLLSRREITCTFRGLAGRLKKLEAVEMISKQFSLDGKVVIPILLKNETGKPIVSGTFYVYEDEKLARKHLKVAIFNRLEKAKGAPAKPEESAAPTEVKGEEKPKEEKKSEEKPKKEEKKAEEKKEKKEESK